MSSPHNIDHLERNKETARRFFNEVFNKGNLAVVDESMSPSYVFDGQPQSAAEVKAWVTGLRTTFPDLHFELQVVLAEGDTVALRWQLTGTNTGGASPTGAKVVNSGTNIVTFGADGKCLTNVQNGKSQVTVNGQTQTYTDSLIYYPKA